MKDPQNRANVIALDSKRGYLLLLLFLFAVSVTTVWRHYAFAPQPQAQVFLRQHQEILAGNTFTPYHAYRVLIPRITDLLDRGVRLFFTPEQVSTFLDIAFPTGAMHGNTVTLAYMIFDSFVLTTLLALFHLFLRRWFGVKEALVGCLFLYGTFNLTYLHTTKWAELTTSLIFLLGFFLILEGKVVLLIPVIVLGMLTKETASFLVPFYLIHSVSRTSWTRVIGMTGVLGLAAVSTFLLTRSIVEGTHPGPAIPWSMVILDFGGSLSPGGLLVTFIITLIVLNITLFLAFYRIDRKPPFFQRALIGVLLYFAVHLVRGGLGEIGGYLLPVLPVLVATSLFSLFRPTVGQRER